MSFSENNLNQIIAIFEDIDWWYQDLMLLFIHNTDNDWLTIKYPQKNLKNCK